MNEEKKNNSQRLQILSQDEVTELYAVPQFNSTERSHYFLLPEKVLHSLKIMKTNGKNTSARLWFILQYGYFKARHQFFNISYDAKEDVAFIMSHYLPNDRIPNQPPSRRIQGSLKSQILQWMEYRDDISTVGQLVAEKAGYLAKITYNIREIFGETIHYLESKKMVLPAYSKLQDMLGAALKAEERRLIQMMKQYLTKRTRLSLKTLFLQDDGFYRITELKLDAKSFQTKEMTNELDKLTLCRPIYIFAKKILPKLSLSRSMIEHYSDLAKLYRVARLRRIPEELSFLYLACYVHGRYERLASNLIQGFLYYVDKYHGEGKNHAKTELVTLASPLEQHYKSIGKLMEIFTDKKIQTQSGHVIRKRAFSVMPEKNIAAISSKLLCGDDDRKKQEQRLIWEYHRDNYQAILINLRPLFMEIDFEGNDDNLNDLFNAIRFLKSNLKQGVSLKTIPLHMIPTGHIKPKALLDLFTDDGSTISTKSTPKKSINQWQYEFYIYRAIRENIRASRVYVNSSVGYKSFEAEVNIPPTWKKEKKKILKKLNNPVLLRPIHETLTKLKNILEPLIDRTNRRALSGENKHINITRHRDGRMTWTIPYPKQNIEIDNPFYSSLEIKTISEIYDFVAQECRFMKAFTPITQRGATKIKKDYLGIKATILANGTMQGTNEFSKRSNLKYQRLQTAEQGHIRLSTLREAADIIANCMLKLPIFDLYDLGGEKHGSVDGTKKKTRRRILKARHSKKYFGTDIGVVIMTMLLGHVPFVTEIIGANEHESHFLFSMLFRNTSDIDPHIISSDTAGTNNINDLMYYLIGKIHAPCYRSATEKTKNICGFKLVSHYKDLLIKPSSQVNTKLIKDTWPELLPIFVSLLSHDSNQENIIKTLNSHDFRSDTKDAIWELNNILKSIHHLKYVDDPEYRQYIRTALNRGEAYHQILEKIMAVGGSTFRGMSELEVEIWNECARLIALIIIYYNMHLLSKLYENALLRNDKAAIEFLKHISPVASQHININGLYEFSEIIENINVDNIVEMLNKILENTVKPSSD